MNPVLYQTALRNEAATAFQLKELHAQLMKSKGKTRQQSNTITPFENSFSLLSRSKKAEVERLEHETDRHVEQIHALELENQRIREELTMVKKIAMDAENDPIYVKGRKVFGFYVESRKRIGNFQACVKEFLVALSEARGAMSANYNRESNSYSTTAIMRIEDAKAQATKLDKALGDIERLEKEFKVEARGTKYDTIELPQFEHKDYNKLIATLTSQPIGVAYMGFTTLLDACEQLDNEGIGEAYKHLYRVEALHEKVTDDIVIKTWQADQKALLLESQELLI